MAAAEKVIVEFIVGLIQRRGDEAPAITAESTIAGDLDLDSLELAELSAGLEDALGKDPYSQGIVPATVGELVAFYA